METLDIGECSLQGAARVRFQVVQRPFDFAAGNPQGIQLDSIEAQGVGPQSVVAMTPNFLEDLLAGSSNPVLPERIPFS
jgi:hypothetical protein